MVFLFIIGCMFVYSLCGCLTATFTFKIYNSTHERRMSPSDEEFLVSMAWVFWPITLCYTLFITVPYHYIYKKIVK
jgi:hypothetical protein